MFNGTLTLWRFLEPDIIKTPDWLRHQDSRLTVCIVCAFFPCPVCIYCPYVLHTHTHSSDEDRKVKTLCCTCLYHSLPPLICSDYPYPYRAMSMAVQLLKYHVANMGKIETWLASCHYTVLVNRPGVLACWPKLSVVSLWHNTDHVYRQLTSWTPHEATLYCAGWCILFFRPYVCMSGSAHFLVSAHVHTHAQHRLFGMPGGAVQLRTRPAWHQWNHIFLLEGFEISPMALKLFG